MKGKKYKNGISKKCFALLISILMVVAMLPSIALAEGSNVCKIGTTEYATLPAAISAAEAGEQIVLIDDVTLSEKLTIDKNITINIGTHTVNSTVTDVGAAITVNSTATITGSGQITGTDGRVAGSPTQDAYLIQVNKGATLALNGVTVKPGETTTNGSTAPATVGVYVFNGTLYLNNATVNGGVSDGQGDGGNAVVIFQSDASLTAENSTITGGALNSIGKTNCDAGVAVYFQGGKNATLTNCNITGGSATKTADNYLSAYGGVALHIQNSGTVSMTDGTLTGGSTTTTPRSGDGGAAAYTPGGSVANLTFSGVAIKGGDSDQGDGGSAISLNGPSDVKIKDKCTVSGGKNTNGEEDCGGAIGLGYSTTGSLSIVDSAVSSEKTAVSLSKETVSLNVEGSTISGGEYSIYLNKMLNSFKAKNSALLGDKVYISDNTDRYSFTKEQLESINNGGEDALVVKVNSDYYFGADKLSDDVIKGFKDGDNITIYNGDMTLTDVAVGVTVTNAGTGDVSVNDNKVGTNGIYKITEAKVDGDTITKSDEIVDVDESGNTTITDTTTTTDTKTGTTTKTEDVVKKDANNTITEKATITTETKTDASGVETTTKTETVKKLDDRGDVTETVKTEATVEKTENVTTTEQTVTTTGKDGVDVVETTKNVVDKANNVEVATQVAESVAKVEAKIADGDATLPTTMTVDATAAKADAKDVTTTEVTLPAATVAAIKDAARAESVKTVELKTDVATLEIDNKALQTLTKDADSQSLLLKVAKTDSTVEETKNATATFELTAVLKSSDGSETPVFDSTDAANNGIITINVAYEPEKADNTIEVYYVAEDGTTKTKMDASYKDGVLSWDTNHFSTYEVIETAKAEPTPDPDDNNDNNDKNNNGGNTDSDNNGGNGSSNGTQTADNSSVNSQSSDSTSATGDDFNIMPLIALILISGGAVAGIAFTSKRRRNS